MNETLSRKEWQAIASKAKASKFKSRAVVLDGIRFASGKEGTRWLELQLMQRGGEISGLERQVIYPLHCKRIRITSLRVDFRYRDRHGRLVLEDVKGGMATITEVFRIKAKWLKAEYGLEVITV